MRNRQRQPRRIALFVEGDSERGHARQATVPAFLRNWLDPQLPPQKKVGITAVKFQGMSNYLDDLAQKIALHLEEGRANVVFGLVDLYGLPPDRIDLSDCTTVHEKVQAARRQIRALVPKQYQPLFRQHFAVHELEAWLLAYPEKFPPKVRNLITKRLPEEVNFTEPPARFLQRILGGQFKKTTYAQMIFPHVDPQIAMDKCPYLRSLAQDLLDVAKQLL